VTIKVAPAPLSYRVLFPLALAAALVLSLAGCENTFEGARQDTVTNAANAQRNLSNAGQAISNTANNAGQAISNTANSIGN
jgi:predicted small secreted protein